MRTFRSVLLFWFGMVAVVAVPFIQDAFASVSNNGAVNNGAGNKDAGNNAAGIDMLYAVPVIDEYAQGYRLLSARQFKSAEAYWRGVLQSIHDEPYKQAVVLQQIAVAQQSSGRFRGARNSLQLAINRLAHVQQNPLRGALYYQLASLEAHMNMLEEAKMHLQNAIRILNTETNARFRGLMLNKVGEIFSRQNDQLQALDYFTKSFDVFVSLADQYGVLLSARNAVVSAISIQRYKQVVEIFSRALTFAEDASDLQPVNLAKVALLGEITALPDSELKTLDVKYIHTLLLLKKIAEADGTDEHISAYAQGVMAELYFRVGRLDQAQLLLNRALLLSQSMEPNPLTVKWLELSGKIYRQQGDTRRAIQAYRLAVDNYNSIRDHRVSIDQRDIVTDEHALYAALADMLLAKAWAEKNSDAKRSLLLEARQTLEQQKITELQNYFNNTCDIPDSAVQTDVDKIITAGSVAIYPVILPDRLEILATFDSGIEQYRVFETEQRVDQVVNNFRANLENLNSRDFLAQAQQLYRWLIGPLEPALKRRGIKNIVIISERVLRTIPLSVLHDGDQYLVQKYAFAVSPGLQLTDPKSLDRHKLRILLSGISEAVQGFPPLRYVRGELEEIQDLYVTKLLLNKEFITENFESEMRASEFSVAHLASHSEFKGSAKDSYILTFDGRMSMQKLGDITSLARGGRQPIELLTLSSCQTAVGDDRAALGLAGVAVKAGAKSALATLWAIDDFASSILVSEFYRQLLNGSVSKAQALQKAQLKLINTRRFGHPAYWSPFLLIGNWL